MIQKLIFVAGIFLLSSLAYAAQADAPGHYVENPFFVLALIGFFQGLISRAGVGSFVIVALVMPVLATWSMVSGANFPPGLSDRLGYIGMELAGTFLFSIAGWGLGLGLRSGLLKLLYRKK